MAIVKAQIQEKLEDGTLRTIHPETEVDAIIETDAKQFISKTEKDKLGGIQEKAQVNTIEKIIVNNVEAKPDASKVVNIVIPTDLGAMQLGYEASTGVLSIKDKSGKVLDSVDLPLELLVESGNYNALTKNLELILANGSKIEIPVGDLIDEYNADETTITMGLNNTFSIAKAILDRITNVETKASNNETEISNIKNGTTKIKSSEQADKFSSNKTLTIGGDASGSVSTDFSTNPTTLNIELAKTGVVAGTYSAVKVDDKGRATAGGQVLEVGTDGQVAPSSSLVVGGLFLKKI